jgi:endonuclease/exonuclease/phosphatase family metal-dependent hydrolase
MKILTWNIQWGLGIDKKFDLARGMAYARATDADIICLQEIADGYADLEGSDGENQFEIIRDLMSEFHAFEGIAVDVPRHGGGRKRFGNMLLSRLPVGRVMRHILPWGGDITPNMPRVVVDAIVMASFGPVHIMTTHLEYSSAFLRGYEVEGLRTIHRLAAERAARPSVKTYGPFVPHSETASSLIMGDFNMLPNDPLKTLIEEPFGEDVPALYDAWKIKNGDASHPPSFCIYDQTYNLPHCCDFMFVSEDLVERIEDIAYDGNTQISDHQPVLLTLAD